MALTNPASSSSAARPAMGDSTGTRGPRLPRSPSQRQPGYNHGPMGETSGRFIGKTRFQPGGTPGGGGAFFGGLVMMAVGVYMVFDRVTVHTSFWHFFGGPQTSFGMTLLPVLTGVG